MATEAQINANRENAKKSTGPKTAKGKAAVSKNAVKHGFFSRDPVVRDEDQEDLDLYREQMLAEMRPVGVMESTLAERIVALAWRLRRAERMQHQALKMQMRTDMLDLIVRQFSWEYRDTKGLKQEECYPQDDHMTFGRAARNDIANYRVLEKLLMYERRIENSMLRMMNELRKLQQLRESDESRAAETVPSQVRDGKCAKQTQSAPNRRVAKSCVEGDYDARRQLGTWPNKPSQSQYRGARSPKMAGSVCCSSKIEGRLSSG